MEYKFGELLYKNDHTKRAAAKLRRKRYLVFLLPVIMFPFSIHMLRDPGFYGLKGEEAFIPYVFLGLAFLSILIAIAIIKRFCPNHISIFENGIIIKSGSYQAELSFEEIDGLTYETSNIKIADALYIYPKDISVTKPRGRFGQPKEIEIASLSTPNFSEVSAYLYGVYYDNYLLKDLSKENIADVVIDFGDGVKLENGKIQNGTRMVDFDAIKKIKTLHGMVLLIGVDERGKTKTLFQISFSNIRNIVALYYIIDELGTGK